MYKEPLKPSFVNNKEANNPTERCQEPCTDTLPRKYTDRQQARGPVVRQRGLAGSGQDVLPAGSPQGWGLLFRQ